MPKIPRLCSWVHKGWRNVFTSWRPGILAEDRIEIQSFYLSLEMVARPPASTRPVPYTLYTLSLDLCAKTINILTAHFIHFLEIMVLLETTHIMKCVFKKVVLRWPYCLRKVGLLIHSKHWWEFWRFGAHFLARSRWPYQVSEIIKG